jgi:putative Ca2+/H+ antiporter (TMEM165/GDT1 family)
MQTRRIADRHERFSVLATSFKWCFVAEWGDLTQIGTAALAARYGAL